MTHDPELCLRVARACGYENVQIVNVDNPFEESGTFFVDDMDGFPYYRPYRPDTDWSDAGPLIEWLTEQVCCIFIDRGQLELAGIGVSRGNEMLAFQKYADHPTPNAAIRRCLCEAVRAVSEKE